MLSTSTEEIPNIQDRQRVLAFALRPIQVMSPAIVLAMRRMRMPTNQPCIHPQLQWCGLTEKQERGDIGAWYECRIMREFGWKPKQERRAMALPF